MSSAEEGFLLRDPAIQKIRDLSNSCNMGARDLPDMYARGMRAYISGKSRAHMLQVICITSVRGRALSSSSQLILTVK